MTIVSELFRAGFWTRWRVIALLASVGVVGVFVGANVHLLAVSVASQAECVPHAATAGGDTYRAAKPSC